MSFRSWRERKLLSQERVSEMSGLSLRTVQRLEAGHRVSYASLRALAAAFQADVDALERELYAMDKPADDFVEMPRWARRLNDGFWSGGLRASRRQVRWLEALLIGTGILLFAASFVVADDRLQEAFRIVGFLELLLGYYVSAASRAIDAYKLWPGPDAASRETPPRRTWRRTVAEYAFLLGTGVLGTVSIVWLMF